MDLKKVGRFIAQKRKEKDYTQDQLGEMLGISSNTLSKWERGVNAPDISLLSNISKILDVSLEELLSGERINEDKKDSTDSSEGIISGMKFYTKQTKNKYLKYSAYSIILILFVFSFLFMITNYNQFKIFGITSKNSKTYVDGQIVFNQERNIIIINNIDLKDNNIATDKEERIQYLKVSLKSNNKIIFSSEKVIEGENNRINSYLLNNTFFADEDVNSKEEVLVKDVDINKLEIVIEYVDIDNENKTIKIPLAVKKRIFKYKNNLLITFILIEKIVI